LNRYYDVPTMIAIAEALGRRQPTRLDVVAPTTTPWDDRLRDAGATIRSSLPEGMPAIEWYRPTERGLEGQIRQKLAELKSKK